MTETRKQIKDFRQFGSTLGAILMIIAAVHFFKGKAVWSYWFAGIGLCSLCQALLAPQTLKPVYFVFLKVTHAIGWFNTRAILIILYFIVVTPIAVLMRMFGKNLLDRKMDKGLSSYWVERKTKTTLKEQFEKQF